MPMRVEELARGCNITVQDVIRTVYETIPDICKNESLSKEQNIEAFWKIDTLVRNTTGDCCHNTYPRGNTNYT